MTEWSRCCRFMTMSQSSSNRCRRRCWEERLPRTVRPSTQPPLNAQARQIGPYKLLEQIGEGGMGVVYRAEQQEPARRTVALKIVKPGMDTRDVISRFQVERQALAMMNHPNIAKVFGAGSTDSGRPYFVMELVEGVPITQYADQNQLNTRQRLELFRAVCEAVQHAHQKGIIHRDIKPSNVLVASDGGDPSPKNHRFWDCQGGQRRAVHRGGQHWPRPNHGHAACI